MYNLIQEKNAEGLPAVGCFTTLGSGSAVESLTITGVDFVIIDNEHGSMSQKDIGDFASILRSRNVTPIVRINSQSLASIQWSLDVGAMGVLVPRLEDPRDLEKLVRLSKYPPKGVRGFGPSRDAGWMHGPDYEKGIPNLMKEANEKTMLIVQCETVGCLEHIEEVASYEGVDCIMVGPYDLSIAMGIPGQFDLPEFQAALARVRNACKAAGKPEMIFTADLATAKKYYQEGYEAIIYSVDIFTLIQGMRSAMKEIRG